MDYEYKKNYLRKWRGLGEELLQNIYICIIEAFITITVRGMIVFKYSFWLILQLRVENLESFGLIRLLHQFISLFLSLSRHSVLTSLFHSLSVSLRPQLPLCDHTEGLQQRGWGDSCVWERHHQTTVRCELHTLKFTRRSAEKTFDLLHFDMRSKNSIIAFILFVCGRNLNPINCVLSSSYTTETTNSIMGYTHTVWL